MFNNIKEKSDWVRKETLKIHAIAQDTRIASSLSAVEIFTVLFYGKIIKVNPININWEGRDRFIISKGHGAISFYPILADFGFFEKHELGRICKEGAFLGGIPDCAIPGFETINGSLGHGLGVGCGIALALKRRNKEEKVFVLVGDGELYEGSIWEAVMFASEHKLDNIILIIDNNKICMLDYCSRILNLEPIEDKFKAFGWQTMRVDGHNVEKLYNAFISFKGSKKGIPKVLIADTVKGKGVLRLENDPLCHVKNLEPEEIKEIIKKLK